jgi:hypothetical protein
VAAGYDDGAYTMAIYFTSEQEAREGERREPPPQLKAQMEEMDTLSVGVPEFFDLKQPWLYSHGEQPDNRMLQGLHDQRCHGRDGGFR